MQDFFTPKSVAVIGVSESYDNFGRNIVKNLIDFEFKGNIYPVGPKGGTVFGMQIWASALDVPGPVDLAIILTPARTVPDLMELCGQKGIKRVVISSGGFSEFGDERRELEARMVEIAERYEMRFIGPNCIGIINNDVGLCLPFPRVKRFRNGPLSIMTQSGGVGLSYIMLFAAENAGMSKYISLGNKLNVSEVDLLPYLDRDEQTEIISLYLEEMEQGRELYDAVRNMSKPVVIFKANRTAEGARIAKSHTAALANDDRIVETAIRQAGAVRVEALDELVTASKALTLPQMKGDNVAVISPTGGFAVIIADACERAGFKLPPFPEQFIKDVSSHVRAGVIKLTNPMDLGDLFDMEMIALTITRALQEPSIDALILGWLVVRDAGLGFSMVNVFPALKKLVDAYKKPVAMCLVGDPTEIRNLRHDSDFPVFETPEKAVEALSVLRRHNLGISIRARKPEFPQADKAAAAAVLDSAPAGAALGREAEDLLAAYGIPVARSRFAPHAEAAAAVAGQIGFPVVLKVVSEKILHKSDAGGVALDLRDPDEVRRGFEAVAENARELAGVDPIDGVLVAPMVQGGIEVIIGARRDPQFGPLVMFGLGGVFVEAYEDVSFRLAPLSRVDAEEMVREIKAYKLLAGFRGAEAADREALAEILIRVGALIADNPRVRELDLNPIKVFEQGRGAMAVDTRVIIEDEPAPAAD